jgi:hypothetical protein
MGLTTAVLFLATTVASIGYNAATYRRERRSPVIIQSFGCYDAQNSG